MIVGCPRSGTTLMLRMTERFDNTHTFSAPLAKITEIPFDDPEVEKVKKENPGKLIITKKPCELIRVSLICRAGHKVVLMVRDGRDVLVSKFRPHRYHVAPSRWLHDCRMASRIYKKYRDQILRIHYEDLVRDSDLVLAQVANFVDRKIVKTWDDLVERRPGYGLLTTDSIGNWKNKKHAERLKGVLKYGDQIADELIDLGYEKDKEWLDRALRSLA